MQVSEQQLRKSSQISSDATVINNYPFLAQIDVDLLLGILTVDCGAIDDLHHDGSQKLINVSINISAKLIFS
jgi:hypothetical protein